MYSFDGVYATFLTDSTLAVSMHKDGAESSPLWEITIDGRIVRQLTFLPEYPSKVNETTPGANILVEAFPNPLATTTTIAFTLAERSLVTLWVTDVAGREVQLLAPQEMEAGRHEAPWDASRFASGIYTCRLQSGGVSAVEKIVVLH